MFTETNGFSNPIPNISKMLYLMLFYFILNTFRTKYLANYDENKRIAI